MKTGDGADAGETCLTDRHPWGGCPVARRSVPLRLLVGGASVAPRHSDGHPPSPPLQITYYDPQFFAVRGLTPVGGPLGGGTQLWVYLIDNRLLVDLGGLSCRFTFTPVDGHDAADAVHVRVPASVGDDEHGPRRHLRCLAPPVPSTALLRADGTTDATLGVSLNGADHSEPVEPSRCTYRYYGGARVDSIAPWGGPTAGGTRVYAVGAALQPLGRVACRFGRPEEPPDAWTAVGGTVVNATHAVCLSPPLRRTRCRVAPASTDAASCSAAVPVCLLLNGQECVPSGALGVFTYYSLDGLPRVRGSGAAEVRLHGLMPSGGPPRGGTLVVVRGRGLVDHGGLGCCFRTLTAHGGGGDGAVQPMLVTVRASSGGASQDAVLCRAPELPEGLVAADGWLTANVTVTLNGDAAAGAMAVDDGGERSAASTRALRFVYDSAPRLSSVWPPAGPHLGGTAVTLRGIGLRRDFGDRAGGTGLRCQFGDAPPEPPLVPETKHGTSGGFSPGAREAAGVSGAAAGLVEGTDEGAELICRSPAAAAAAAAAHLDGMLDGAEAAIAAGQQHDRSRQECVQQEPRSVRVRVRLNGEDVAAESEAPFTYYWHCGLAAPN